MDGLVRQHLHKQRETIVDTDVGFNIVRTIDARPMIEGVKMKSELVKPAKDGTGRLYLGSVDPITAVNWAKECGHGVYSKEWREFALKKLRSGEFSHFRADNTRKYG